MIGSAVTTDELRMRVRTRLLHERVRGCWRGELSASALSTAIAALALHQGAQAGDRARIAGALRWLCATQLGDGSWGDTVTSIGNLSTTVVVWAALGALVPGGPAGAPHQEGGGAPEDAPALAAACARAAAWIAARSGSLAPGPLAQAVEARYGEDRTFAVPILMLCAIAGRLGDDPWRLVRPLPFELAACPRAAFRFLDLQVVSYALPALIAVGLARHRRRRPGNPIARLARDLATGRTLRLLAAIQPASGGFLEAIPLTGFVALGLLAAGEAAHPVVERCLGFLRRAARADGSWAIDIDLATWVTTGAINALAAGGLDDLGSAERGQLRDWLLGQQQRTTHPYTGSAPGGFAWTDLPGGVPDADDTAGALIALHHLGHDEPQVVAAARSAIAWLLGLQNRDGGIPTFCRGWGALEFDRSAPDLTAHALAALVRWQGSLDAALLRRVQRAVRACLAYLRRVQRADGSWVPLWFGNERIAGDLNPTYATARVVQGLVLAEPTGAPLRRGVAWLQAAQNIDGGWGGGRGSPSSIEESALALDALAAAGVAGAAIERGVAALRALSADGTVFTPAPIGFYFAKLWYSERLYPLIFASGALERLHAREQA
jgi:squalene-hopene/tetraprenyl-beta-curcumene cyclase